MKKENFRELLEKTKNRTTYQVKAPSGLTYTCRLPNMESYILAGRLPDHLLQILLSVYKEKNGETAPPREMTAAEFKDLQDFMSLMVTDALVHPKIVKEAIADNEVRLEELPQGDIGFIFNWTQTGGEQGQALENFRPESR